MISEQLANAVIEKQVLGLAEAIVDPGPGGKNTIVHNRVLQFVAEGLVQGLRIYGPLNLATDHRDFMNEASEEIRDAIVYLCAGWLQSSTDKVRRGQFFTLADQAMKLSCMIQEMSLPAPAMTEPDLELDARVEIP